MRREVLDAGPSFIAAALAWSTLLTMADDVSGATVYQVAVPVGTEHAMARAYGEDPAVYAAAVDRETIGYLTADTALPTPAETSPILLGIGVLLVAGAIAIRRSSAAMA